MTIPNPDYWSTDTGSTINIRRDPVLIWQPDGLGEVQRIQCFTRTLDETVPITSMGGIHTGTVQTIGAPITTVSITQTELYFGPLQVTALGTNAPSEVDPTKRFTKYLPVSIRALEEVITVTGTVSAIRNGSKLPADWQKGNQGQNMTGSYVFKPAGGDGSITITIDDTYVLTEITEASDPGGLTTSTWTFRRVTPTSDEVNMATRLIEPVTDYYIIDIAEFGGGPLVEGESVYTWTQTIDFSADDVVTARLSIVVYPHTDA
ncbi:MAG: hypothetical protein DRP85_04155 [Candidatus Makaraimicrobium thalassicum]|nr:MAG: hypothetical protein DRP85_04155 [Candidatus Omnitrophota bacterium]